MGVARAEDADPVAERIRKRLDDSAFLDADLHGIDFGVERQVHQAFGLGIYDVYFKTDIRMENSIEVPEHPGICIYHACNVSLSDPGPRGIGYVINGQVPSTFNTYRVCRRWIDKYVGGVITSHSKP